MDKIMSEIWKDIENYEGYYMISNFGNIKSLSRYVRGSLRKERILNKKLHRDGYYMVTLQKDKKRKYILVHRLVASHFVENKSNKPDVNHIDGVKINNVFNNLEWVTSKENSKHAVDLGLSPHSIGETHIKSKLNNSDIIDIRKSWNGLYPYTQNELAIKYNISKSNIAKILKKETWKHI